MKIFEMTLYQGIDDSISQLYFENNEISRAKFIDKIQQIIKEEFNSSLKNQHDDDLNFFYKEIYNESCSNLALVKDKFIKQAKVEHSIDFFFTIQEKLVE